MAPAQTPASDPPYLIKTWQTEDGLPENIVNALAQTPDGYLWCGTTLGLARFDGVRFSIFNEANAPALGSARIRQLLVDRDGALWISNSEGRLIRYANGSFTAFTPPPRESVGRVFIRMMQDAGGALWLTAEDGALLRFADGAFRVVSENWSARDATGREFYHIHMDSKGAPWVASRAGLARVEGGDTLVPALQGTSRQYGVLCSSRSGGWWLQSAGRIRLWRDGQWIADVGEQSWGSRVADYCIEDRQGRLWVAPLGDGLFRFATNAPMLHITASDGLGSDLVRTVFEDAEGNIWTGNRAGGLNRLRAPLFHTYTRKNGLSSDLITAVCEGEPGEMWVGTDGDGLNRMKDGEVTQFGSSEGLSARHIRALAFDGNHNLWVGAWPGGLLKRATNRFVMVRNFSGNAVAVASLLEDSRGKLWLGQRTLNQMACLTNGVAAAVLDVPNSAPSMDIISMAEDSSGNIWFGTDGSGLLRWGGGQWRSYHRQDGLPGMSIRSLWAETNGALWIGTLGGGLCRLKDNRIVACSTRDGLVDNVINHIADDGRGNLWFTSFQGIFKAPLSELNAFADGALRRVHCITYGRSDGLPSMECPGGFQPAGCRAQDGRLWFPTIKGLVVVDPNHMPTNFPPPQVWIEEVLVDDLPSGSAQAGGGLRNPPASLVIPPGQHRFEFRYTGVNLSAPERVHFRCQLEGLEDKWVAVGAQRSVNYNGLRPGEYRFRVTACNQAGVWNETEAAIAFRLLPHFWQTSWFMAILLTAGAAAVGGAAFYISRRRMRRRLAHLETQLSLERERGRIAQDIHDGVGANLTEIAWLAELAGNEAENPDEVRTQTRKISGTARETVRSFDEIVWAVLPQNDTLASLIEYLGRRVDEWFENSPTRCWFSAPNQVPPFVVPSEVRHGFYLACKEALHNVNQHAGAGEVRVRVTVEERQLRVEITDNGCGFDPDAVPGGGNGLRNLRERFAALNGHFDLWSRPGQGTRVTMVIPLSPPACN